MTLETPVIPQSGEITPKDEIADGISYGNLIVDALETYFDGNGKYPRSLDELTPVYIDTIPVIITGQEYENRFLEPDNIFGEPYLLVFYLKTEKMWAVPTCKDLKTGIVVLILNISLARISNKSFQIL